jgi:hypothetical protein
MELFGGHRLVNQFSEKRRTPYPQSIGVNQYLSHKVIDDLAVAQYQMTGKGITYNDILQARYANSKKKAQDKLKYYKKKGISLP